jgi:hypothetical protein
MKIKPRKTTPIFALICFLIRGIPQNLQYTGNREKLFNVDIPSNGQSLDHPISMEIKM